MSLHAAYYGYSKGLFVGDEILGIRIKTAECKLKGKARDGELNRTE